MKIKIDIAPSGPGCRHVLISDPVDGHVLDVMTLDDWDDEASNEESALRVAVKTRVRHIKQISPNANPQAIKAQLEGGEL